MAREGKEGGSFRDPSGFVFFRDGTLYRQVDERYREHYDTLMSSGLYKDLIDSALLIPHEEVDLPPHASGAYRIIKPERVGFISYPYEWSFSQLKDAALTMLRIQQRAMEFGMSLRDASAYNIQFHRGVPVLIDTLSFGKYEVGKPWIAYGQFCRHFLAPLLLMSYRDMRLSQLLRVHLDGIPLDLASSLLPKMTYARWGVLTHIHMHGKSERHFADKPVDVTRYKMSKTSLLGLIDSLYSLVSALRWEPGGTEWAEYYTFTNYSDSALNEKKKIVESFIDLTNPQSVWDLGANNGFFSRAASDKGVQTIAFDIDPAAVEKNYLEVRKRKEAYLLPLLSDLTNLSPALGWHLRERKSFFDRGPADLVLALALVHHLAISNNVPFPEIAEFFSALGTNLIIEFVPKTDSQVQKLLSTREDIFTEYTESAFERDFGVFFQIQERIRVMDSDRKLYLMIPEDNYHSTGSNRL